MFLRESLIERGKRQEIIHKAAEVLWEIGIECNHRKAIDVLSQKTKIEYRNGRICIEPGVILEYLEKRRLCASNNENNQYELIGPWCSFELCDPYTNEIRLPSDDEVIKAAKLIDSITVGWGPFGGAVPLYSCDMPSRLATLKAEKIALMHTKKLGGKLTATDKSEIEIISLMYKAAGRKYKLALQGLISPLRLNTDILNTFFEQDDNNGIDMEISCAIPMAGATTSLIFPAALIQSVAESIAVDFIFNTLSNRMFDVLTIRLEPFDVRYNNIVFGSPEWCVLNRAVIELESELRGVPRRYGVFRSNSKKVDFQSICERSMAALWQGILGVKKFGAVGQLCVDEVFSPLQAVLDMEILKYVKRVLEEFNGCWDEDADYIEILREGIKDGTFLGLESTVWNLRKFYSFDNFFSYNNLNSWRKEGNKGAEEFARGKLEKIISNHTFRLPDDKIVEIEELYSEGVKLLQ